MTYCVAALVREGIVFASDSRTSAGADNIAVFSKMMCWEIVGERVVVVLSSGNLATTQSVISLLKMRSKDNTGAPLSNGVLGVKKLYEVAELVGATLREVVQRERSVRDEGVEIDASFIIGGQIDNHTPRLFRVYSEGNFIEASSDTNFFQIGETKYGKPIIDRVVHYDTPIKYGKPIIDRVVHYDTPMKEVAKSFLVSFDSTMRSNLSVGLPIDLIAYERDAHRVTLKRRFKNGDAYFSRISGVWSAGLRRAFAEVPDVPWVDEPEPVDRRRG